MIARVRSPARPLQRRGSRMPIVEGRAPCGGGTRYAVDTTACTWLGSPFAHCLFMDVNTSYITDECNAYIFELRNATGQVTLVSF